MGSNPDTTKDSRCRVLVKAVTPKCLHGPLVDRDRLNAYPGVKRNLLMSCARSPNTIRVRIFFSLPTLPFLPSHPSSQWETSRPTNRGNSSPVTDRIPSLHFPSQTLVESSPRPLVERATPNDPRSHDDPE
ncbi:hypothetical protein TNCV_2895631 [Trichonephila clavipes]|nr:hypothetical protein TNCV_2895631 [Trichonephila clavipes]